MAVMFKNVSSRTKRSFAWLAALFFCGWLAIELYMPWRAVHYRLDVTFEVDGVPVTGSGVQKFFIIRDRVPLSPGVLNTWTYGEAVIVDLPGKKSVYALMTTARDDGSYSGGPGAFDFLVIRACNLQEKNKRSGASSLVRLVGGLSGTCQVPLQDIPLMVSFENETDPTSVQRVFPDHPESTLGGNVKFLKASITITHQKVTTGIEQRLPWLAERQNGRLTPNFVASLHPTLPDYLRYFYFRRK